MNERGVTLIETLIILALLATILAISIPFTLEMIRQAKAEAEIRTLYSNLTDARQRAMERNVQHLVNMTATAVSVYEDPNANGTIDLGEKKIGNLSLPKLDYGLTSPSTFPFNVVLNTRGMMLPTAMVRLDTNELGVTKATVNCVVVTPTRVNQGKYDGSNCIVQ